MDEPAAKKKPSDPGEEAEPQDDGQQQINTSPQPSVKRRKIGPISANEERKEPPSSHLINQSNKVIWVDIGINPEETYWWPGLVYENHFKSYVALMPNSKSKLVDIKPKSLNSVKATMAFKAHLVFNSIEQNLISKNKELAQKYPTKKSLEKAYVIARKKTVIYSFREDHDDLPDVSACMIPLSQESRAVLANVFSPKQKKSQATSPESEDLDDDDSELDDFDGPDQELEIPGETILCRSSAKSQDYWPARVISYTRLKLDKRTIRGGKLSKKSTRKKSEKTYQIQSCDRSFLVTPRSPFETTDQENIYTVKRRKKEKLIAESNLESSTSNNQIDQDKDQANPSVPENNTITTEKILEEAKKLATLDIHEVDLVDKVHSLRASQKSHLCI
ncbi:hypothetical protein KEM48_012762 [Puccinia striiformis f. sp. tritici PST-130]|nr:hypothetical protein KEM48_012762 [Puccinia striiformis f. sp. tritici PST-130]